MFAIIQAAGWPVWALLITSVIALALIIDRLVALRASKVIPAGLLNEVLGHYAEHGVSPEYLREVAMGSPLGQVFAAGLRNHAVSRAAMKETIEEEGRTVAHDLGRFVGALGTIASIAPLMGLFGTVIGMIEIFGSQSPAGTNPQELAHGISVALYNTAFGLIIAVPSMIFFRYYRGLIDDFVVEMERQAARLIDAVQGGRRARQGSAGGAAAAGEAAGGKATGRRG